MSDFAIPHAAPLRFVKKRISATLEYAVVEISFDQIPTIGMLIEAATQSSSGILNDEINGRIGFLISLNNIQMIEKPKSTKYQVDVHLDNKMGDIRALTFKIYDNKSLILQGAFVIGLQS